MKTKPLLKKLWIGSCNSRNRIDGVLLRSAHDYIVTGLRQANATDGLLNSTVEGAPS